MNVKFCLVKIIISFIGLLPPFVDDMLDGNMAVLVECLSLLTCVTEQFYTACEYEPLLQFLPLNFELNCELSRTNSCKA